MGSMVLDRTEPTVAYVDMVDLTPITCGVECDAIWIGNSGRKVTDDSGWYEAIAIVDIVSVGNDEKHWWKSNTQEYSSTFIITRSIEWNGQCGDRCGVKFVLTK